VHLDKFTNGVLAEEIYKSNCMLVLRFMQE
jgi:hypothetical protein